MSYGAAFRLDTDWTPFVVAELRGLDFMRFGTRRSSPSKSSSTWTTTSALLRMPPSSVRVSSQLLEPAHVRYSTSRRCVERYTCLLDFRAWRLVFVLAGIHVVDWFGGRSMVICALFAGTRSTGVLTGSSGH